MSNLENYQLVHPELLTEETLLQILKDRCIVVPRLKYTGKTELIEIFNRVALPLPQRRFDDSTYTGRKLIGLRKSKGQQETALPGIAELSSKNKNSGPNQGGWIVDGIIPPLAGIGMELEKIRLSKSSTIPHPPWEIQKRKSEEASQESPGCNKRQKITWP